MVVAIILVVLAVAALVAILVTNKTSGARPDQPLRGTDGPEHGEAAGQGSTWKADRPGGPGLEGMNPEVAGDPSAGPISDEAADRDGDTDHEP